MGTEDTLEGLTPVKRIQKWHHENSQLHEIPEGEKEPKHQAVLKCPCRPKVFTKNGHLLVIHRRMGPNTEDLASIVPVNYGNLVGPRLQPKSSASGPTSSGGATKGRRGNSES